jgi:hypothetical protein
VRTTYLNHIEHLNSPENETRMNSGNEISRRKISAQNPSLRILSSPGYRQEFQEEPSTREDGIPATSRKCDAGGHKVPNLTTKNSLEERESRSIQKFIMSQRIPFVPTSR